MKIKRIRKFINILFPISIGLFLAAIPILYLQATKTKTAQAGWYNSGWTYRMRFVIDEAQVTETSNITNFHLLINKRIHELSKAQASGNDIIFTSGDGTTVLPHEIEYFNNVSGELTAWVEVSTLSYNADTDIYMYYGNPTASNQQQPSQMWGAVSSGGFSATYVGAWHLNQDPSGSAPQMLDSTANNYDGTTNGSMTASNASRSPVHLGVGNSTDNSQYVDLTNGANLNFGANEDFSLLLWSKVIDSGFRKTIIGKASGNYELAGVGFGINYRGDLGDKRLQFRINDATNTTWSNINNTAIDIGDGQWHHMSISADRDGDATIYTDGTNSSSGSILNEDGDLSSADSLLTHRLRAGISSDVNISVDEIWVLQGTITAGFAETTYNNQASSTFFKSVSNEQVQKDPILFHKFDESATGTANDTSPYNHDGTETGVTRLTGTNCIEGACLSFDNTGDYITVSDSNLLDSNNRDFTLSGWVYRSSSSVADDTLIAKRNGTANSNQGYLLYIRDSDDKLVFEVCDATSSCDEYSLISTSSIATDTWTQFAVVWDDDSATNSEIYLNGKDDDPDNNNDVGTLGNIGDLSNAVSLVIGAESDLGSPHYGRLDEVKIYGYARTAAEILADYNTPSTEKGTNIGVMGTDLPSPAGFWKLDEGYGDTTYNATSNTGINGNLGGGTTCPTTGACPTQSLAGKFDKALSFDGSDDYVEVSAASSINLQSKSGYSVCAWINPTSIGEGSAGEFWSKGNSYMRISTGNGIQAGFDLATTDATLTATKTVSLGTWSHVCAGWTDDSDDEITIYVNGETAGTSVATGNGSPSNDSASNMFIGGDSSNNFHGVIDNVRIYTQELTASEAKADMNYASATNFGTGTSERDVVEGTDYTTSLGAYWNADENTGSLSYDKSGNNNTTDSFSTPWSTGKFGSAFAFDGTDDVIQITETTLTDKGATTDSYTLMAWIKTSANYSANAYVVAKNDGSGAYPYALYLNSSEQACFQISDGTNSPSVCATSPTLADGNWHNITGKRDVTNDSLYIYIDGYPAAAATTDSTTATTVNNDKLTFGNGGSSYTTFDFNGSIDDIKFFTSSLTNAQIAQEVNRGFPVGWWKFDECTGTDINDSGTGANDGTLTVGGSVTYTTTGTCGSGTASEFWHAGSSGKFSSSGAFETDDYVTVTNANEIDFDIGLSRGLSLTTWLKPLSDGEGNLGEFFDKGTNNYCRTSNETVINSLTYVDIECNIDGSSDISLSATSVMQLSTWNHVALTVSGNDGALYINGVLKDTSTGSGIPAGTDTSPILIGGDTSRNFHGLIDDMRLFTYPLSQEQVQSVMNGGNVNFKQE